MSSSAADAKRAIRIALENDGHSVDYLGDFVQTHYPSFPWEQALLDGSATFASPELKRRLESTILSPYKDLPKLNSPRPVCHEPVRSLVDGVVSSLLKRSYNAPSHYQHNRKHKPKSSTKQWFRERNVLTEGYVIASDHNVHHSTMRPCSGSSAGILCTKPNANTAFCNTSSLLRILHRCLGDELFRVILLYTRIFIPVAVVESDQVSSQTVTSSSASEQPTTRKRKRQDDQGKRARSKLNQQVGVLRNNGADSTATTATSSARSSSAATNTTDLTAATFLPTACDSYILLCGPPLPRSYTKRARKYRLHLPSSRAVNSSNGTAVSDDTIPEDCANVSSLHLPPRKRRKRHQLPAVTAKLKPNGTICQQSHCYSSSFVPHVGLPHKNIMNRARNGKDLLQHMIPFRNENGFKIRKKWVRLRQQGSTLCSTILQNHAKCDYHRILERYCPLDDRFKKTNRVPSHFSETTGDSTTDPSQRTDIPLNEIVVLHTPSDAVASFFCSALKAVFPTEFWGSAQNFDVMARNVNLFVSLRKKEKLSNKTLLHGLRVTKMKWLQHINIQADTKATKQKNRTTHTRSNHDAMQKLALVVLRWTFFAFIIPLTRSIFHVTETEFSIKKLLYYRKPVWSRFRSMSLQKLSTQQFTSLTQLQARMKFQQQSLKFSTLRLVPKNTGFRPIIDLSCAVDDPTEKAPYHHDQNGGNDKINPVDTVLPTPAAKIRSNGGFKFLSTNFKMSQVFDALQFEMNRTPAARGAGLDGLSEFYMRYRRFIKAHRHQQTRRQLYFASVDVKKCYDTINQAHLMKLVEERLLENEYYIEKTKVLLTDSGEECNWSNWKKVGPAHSYRPLLKEFRPPPKKAAASQSNIVDKVSMSFANRTALVGLLAEHIQNNLVVTTRRFGNQFLMQSCGIPQGSILSNMLCNLYYSDIENRLLDQKHCIASWRQDQESGSILNTMESPPIHLLARQVDDFILISTEKGDVETFLKQTHRGIPSLGMSINEDKTSASYDISILDIDSHNDTDTMDVDGESRCVEVSNKACVVLATGARCFPWCGMLLDIQTGEVRVDYSRFNDGRAQNSLSVDRNGSEGLSFASRLRDFVRPRCNPILYDSTINSWKVVVSNYYQMMLYCAVKTAEYLSNSSYNISFNLQHTLKCIDAISLLSFHMIKRNLIRKVPSTTSAIVEGKDEDNYPLLLRRGSSQRLSWQAYHDVFRELPNQAIMFQQIRKRTVRTKSWSASTKAILNFALVDFNLDRKVKICPASCRAKKS